MSKTELVHEYATELKTTSLEAVRREWDKIKAMTLEELEALTGRRKFIEQKTFINDTV